MYRILYNNSIIFDPYGDANEVVIDARMTNEINAASYLDFTMAPTHPLYDVIAEHEGIVSLYSDGDELFEGVIDSIEVNMQAYKSISCVSALDYLNDTIVRNYSTIAGEAELTAPTSVDGYFQWLIDQHNEHVHDERKMFVVGINQGSAFTASNYIYRSSTSNPTTASEISTKILDDLGGYLTLRYENGLKILDLYSDVHEMNTQVIDFGVNLVDFTKKTETKDQYTAVIPKGGTPSFEDGNFDSGTFDKWPSHGNAFITRDQVHSGSHSAYFNDGNGEFINSTFFYAKEGARYKSTVWIKNERSAPIKVYPRYQVFETVSWSNRVAEGAPEYSVPNDGQWHEYSFDFLPRVNERQKIRARWVFDNVGNDSWKRVYVDDFNFRRLKNGQDVAEDPITISNIPDGVSSFDSDIYKQGDALYSISYSVKYGYKEKVYSDSTIFDEEELEQVAIKAVNKLKAPQIGIEAKAVDLSLYMEGYTHLSVGQAVRVRSMPHKVDEYLMVNSIDLDLQNPGRTTYDLGASYDTLTGQQSSFIKSLNSSINSSLDAVAALDETTKDQAIKIGTVTEVANKAQETANTANTKAENAQTSADNAQAAADANKNSIDAANAEIEAAKQGIANAEGEIVTVNGRIDTMNGQIESINHDITGVNGRIDSVNDEIGAVNSIIDSTNDRIDSMNGEIETVSGNVNTLRNDLNNQVSDLNTQIETVSSNVNTLRNDLNNQVGDLNTQIETVSGSVDSLRTEVSTEVQNVKDSVDAVSSKADSAMDKASVLAGNLESTNAIVNQHADKIGELTTTVSNATTKADSALRVATEATQTANSFKTTATTAYENANEALTQSSTAVQKANEVSLNLSTNYQTKADADALYATQASLKATSDSITSTVEKTYATKSSVETLQNIADSAIETWVGSEVPTGENEPASHWNTAELKRQHSGDIYYDSETGYSYRYGSTDGTVYSWTMIKDSDIQKAIQDAANAQIAAEGAKDSVDQLALDIPNIYATKSELTQTSDSIKATVSEASKTATSALNKATSVEQTANGLKATVTEQGTKLDDTVKTVNKVSAKADSLSTSITQTNNKLNGYMLGELSNKGFETGDTTGWTKTDGFGTIQVVDKQWGYKVNTGNCSMMITTPTNADSYLICSDTITIQGGHKYKVTCYFNDNNSFRQYFRLGLRFGSKASEYQYVYHKFMSACSTNFYLVEAIIEAPATLANSTATSYPGNICFGTHTKWNNKIKLYVDDFTIEDVTTLEAANSSATEALTKATQVEQTVDSFKTSVSETLKTTTETLDGLVADGFTNLGFERGTLDEWETSESFGTVSITKYPISGKYSLESKSPFSSGGYLKSTKSFDVKPHHTYRLSVTLKFLSDTLKFKFGIYAGHTEANSVYLTEDFSLFAYDAKTFTTEVTIPDKFTGSAYPAYLYLELTSNVTTANRYLNIDDFTIEDITDVKNVADDAAAAIEKASTLEQTVDGFKTTVSQTYETKEDALKKESSVNQRVDSITSTVSEQATKLDQTVTTVSEVKQTADSLTSQMSQATTDASNANEKATSALTKASSLEQSLDGFKTTVSQTYETKQDALNKQSSLNQTIDGFKTTVSQTYTTKTDFNNLQIGGTNRALLTGTPKTASGNNTSNQCVDLYTMPGKGYELFGADDVMVSYDIAASGDTLSGTYIIQGNGNTGWGFANGPSARKLSDIGNGNTLHIKDKVKFGPDRYNNFNGLQIRMDNASGTLTISNFKIEKGNKATAWSPAPEDVEYTYATKSEVTQTANSLKSSISQTNKNIEGITTNVIKNPGFETGGLEQWAIDGGMSNVYVNNINPHGDSYKLIIVTPSTGAWTMKSNTVTVVKNHTYEISCWVWADKAVNAKLGIYAGGYYSTNDVAISASTSWQRISVRRTLQNGYSDARISFGFSDAISESNNIRVDDFELRDITEGYDASGVANSALTKASTLEQTVDGFKTTVSQTYETKQDALNKQSSLNQTIDGFKTNVSQTYETKQDALNKQSSLNQTIDGFKTNISQTYETKADALKKQSTLNQTIDGFKTTVSQTYETKQDALNKQSSLNQTIDGFKTNVSQTYETKQDALNKQSTLNQTIDGFKTNVSQTYATKTSLNALSNQADVTYAMSVLSNTKNYWIRLGTATISEQGRITQLTLNVSKGNNGLPDQNAKAIIQIHKGWVGGDASHQFGVSVDNANWKEIQVKAFSNANNKVTIWIYNSVAGYLRGNYTVSGWRDSWEDQGLTQTGAPAGTEQQVAMNVSLEDVNDKATSALTKSSELEQTLDGFKTTVSQTYETKTDSLAKQSTLNQKVDSLRSEVSETYATKTALNNASSTTNMWPNQWFDASKPCIGRAPVGGEIEAAPVGGNIRIIDSRDHYNVSVSSSVMPGRKYKVSVDAKKISGTNSVISGGIWYPVQSSGNSWDGVGDFAKVKDYGNNWYRFERTVTVPNGKTMGRAWLQLNENSGSNNPAKWKISNLRFEDVTDIADIQANYSTKSYVDQTARTVSLGVVEEYKNGQHGSALATQSDISVAKDSITSTVSKTYTTKTDFNNLQISGGRNIARDTKAFGRNNVTDKDTGYLRAYVDRTNGTYNGCTVRSLTSSDATSQTVFEYGVNNIILGEYYTMSFWAKGSGTMKLYCYGPSGYVAAKRIAASDGQAAAASYNDGATNMTLSSGWKRYWVVWQLYDNPPGGYSASKYFLLRNDNKMSSCNVCGVMIEKGNKASEWAPAPEDIEKTYATKSEVTQTADGLSVTISGVRETANSANSTASTANVLASNATTRVGNLETCIKMTTDGVRVGKISNNKFSGYSALVNANASYDILDGNSNVISRMNDAGLSVSYANGKPGVTFGRATFNYIDESGNVLATASGANIDADTLLLNGQPVSMCESIFKIKQYNTTGIFQYLNIDGSSKLKFDEINSSSVRRTAKLTNTKDVIEVTPGWYAISGVIDIHQDLKKSAHVELRWMLNDYAGGGFKEVSYLPSYMLLHDMFDIEKEWHRITLPVYHLYISRTSGFYPKLMVTRHLNGSGNAAPDNIMIGSRTYIQVTRMPFGALAS